LQRRAAWPIHLLWRPVERRKKFLARKDEEGLIEYVTTALTEH